MEAKDSSETLVRIYQIALRHIAEERNPNIHHSEAIKFQKMFPCSHTTPGRVIQWQYDT
jgi:hypothetical protein